MKTPKRLNNNSGLVLITVVMVTIIIMIFTVGIVGRNYSLFFSTRDQTDRLIAEQIAQSIYWQIYHFRVSNDDADFPLGSVTPVTVNGKTYTPSVTMTPNVGEHGTDLYEITISY